MKSRQYKRLMRSRLHNAVKKHNDVFFEAQTSYARRTEQARQYAFMSGFLAKDANGETVEVMLSRPMNERSLKQLHQQDVKAVNQGHRERHLESILKCNS